jgi:hypothetical protein
MHVDNGESTEANGRDLMDLFRGRGEVLFSEVPITISPQTIAALIRRNAVKVVAVDNGKRRRLALRLVH